MEMKSYAPGMFCWFELGTSDQEAAKTFYSELFGWKPSDFPMGEGQTYTMLQINGKDAAALFKLGPEMAGVPPHWGTYVAVTSADEAAKKVTDHGGKVIMPPFDVYDFGRMAVFQDPTGATLSVWEAKKHIGASVFAENNAVCWNELMTTDSAAAEQFYTSVFGWTPKHGDIHGTKYTEVQVGGQSVGGMMQMGPEFGGMPSHWMIYFAVDDTEAAAARATRLGGQVKVPPTDIPNIGRFAVLQDPQGAFFSIIKIATK